MRKILAYFAQPLPVRLFGIAIGAVFVVAGLAKIGDVEAFAAQVHNFRLTPIALEPLVAMILPWIELVAGTALIFGRRSRAAAWICSGLMIVFTVAVAQAAVRGLDFECGCFGKAGSASIGITKLLENSGLTLLALLATRGRD